MKGKTMKDCAVNAEIQLNQTEMIDEELDQPELIEEQLYAIIVHGLVPEFMPHLAFRRDKHYKTEGKKEIKCPFCRDTLTIVEITAKLELIRYPKKVKSKVPWHKTMPCGKCNNVIGIIYKVS